MSSLPLRVYDGEKWVNIGVQSGQVLYQNEEPSSPQTGSIWIDSDSETAVLNDQDFLTINSASAIYAPSASPTFSGQVNLPATTNYDGTQLSTTLGSKLPFSFGTATPTTTTSGFLWYDSNSTPAATKFWNGSAFVPFGGKILQVVRATDSTDRSTSSTSFVDASISVTITPQKSDSAIIVIAASVLEISGNFIGFTRITDASDNPISGAEEAVIYFSNTGAVNHNVIGYATPATTNATTYKLRFRTNSGASVAKLNNATFSTGQMYAIEVSA